MPAEYLSSEYIKNKFSKPFVLGLAGVATVGKDTFYSLLKSHLADHGITIQRFALADKLKDEIDPFLKERFGISAWTTDKVEKELIRPMLVAYGAVWRKRSMGTHWTKGIQPRLEEAMSNGIFPVMTDIRYDEYEFDEAVWLNAIGGKLAHISRYTEFNGARTYVRPPNIDEERNDPRLKARSFVQIEWDTVSGPCIENRIQYLEQLIKAL